MNNDSQYKLTTGQALMALLEEERAEELDRKTEAMSKQEHIAALEAEGISKDAQAAYFEKQRQRIRDAIARQPAPANVVPIREDVATQTAPARKRRLGVRDLAFMASGSGIAAAAAIVIRVMSMVPEDLPITAATGSAPPLSVVDAIREGAFTACGRGHWRECLAGLDHAKRLDPAGDETEDAKRARQIAEGALNPETINPNQGREP